MPKYLNTRISHNGNVEKHVGICIIIYSLYFVLQKGGNKWRSH